MGHIRDPAGITRGFLSGRRSTDLDFANEENACAVQCGLSNRRRTTANLTPAPSPLMSESLDTFEGETGMPTESHQPWRATSAWAWGKRGTGRAAQDKRRGGEERTGLSNAELAKEEETIIASSPSFAEEDMENSHPPCKAASFSSPALANAELPKATSASPSARATSPSPSTDDDKENRSALNPPPLNSKKRKNGSSKLKLQKKKSRRSTQGENTSIVSPAPIAAEEEEENAAAAPASASFSSPALANAKRSKATSASPSARATSPSPSADDDKENRVERNRESKRRRTQLQTSDAMALDPLPLNPISSNSSNGTDFDFDDFDFDYDDDDDDDDDDPYKPRNDFSHPGDVALRGLVTKWGEPLVFGIKVESHTFSTRDPPIGRPVPPIHAQRVVNS